MSNLAIRSTDDFTTILHSININLYKFDLKRCDERTFYVTISLHYEQHEAICDLIYLIDKEELYGAISLNNLYERAQQFFLKHFKYELMYTDEMLIAKNFSQTIQLQACLKTYSEKYPKYVQPKFFK
ncbi:hypothetical protein [Solibacillus sp. FSL H8-0538]|uniref:hypothetical protein n=1 Tax=Solibacillus sp. FSL H8-0538 TaxID=2921400 RepID=UPI0030FC60EC